jgi:hypothetical protein
VESLRGGFGPFGKKKSVQWSCDQDELESASKNRTSIDSNNALEINTGAQNQGSLIDHQSLGFDDKQGR